MHTSSIVISCGGVAGVGLIFLLWWNEMLPIVGLWWVACFIALCQVVMAVCHWVATAAGVIPPSEEDEWGEDGVGEDEIPELTVFLRK